MDYCGDTPEDVLANATFSALLAEEGGGLDADQELFAADFFQGGWEAATHFWLGQHQATVDQLVRLKLMQADVGACTCLTKTPEPAEHGATCRHRLIMEALLLLDQP